MRLQHTFEEEVQQFLKKHEKHADQDLINEGTKILFKLATERFGAEKAQLKMLRQIQDCLEETERQVTPYGSNKRCKSFFPIDGADFGKQINEWLSLNPGYELYDLKFVQSEKSSEVILIYGFKE